jgi:hypothetical protein
MMIISYSSFGQAHVITVGLQYKPIFPISFLGTGTQSSTQDNAKFDLTLTSGFSAGMLIRKGFTDLISVESGINYVKRKYQFVLKDSSYTGTTNFQMIGYQIPLSMLVYIRLSENIFMNASMGVAADMFASNVRAVQDSFHLIAVRKNIVQPAVISNVGWEWRTQKSGYFYLGASFHRPFSYIFVSKVTYARNGIPDALVAYNTINGSYLTIDFRYFFHEEPQKKYKTGQTNE